MRPEGKRQPEGVGFEFADEETSEQEAPMAESMETLREFADEEAEELAIPAREQTKVPKRSKFRLALVGVTVGLMFAMATPEAGAEKLEPSEKQKIELQMQELQAQLDASQEAEGVEKQEARMQELNEWIKSFNVKGLRVGEVKNLARTPAEQVGIYFKDGNKKEVHLGDIVAEGSMKISQVQLVSEVSDMLDEAGIEYETGSEISAEAGFEVDMDIEAKALLESWGGGMEGGKIDYGDAVNVLELDSQTESVTVVTGGKTDSGEQIVIVHVLDKDGDKAVAKVTEGKILDITSY